MKVHGHDITRVCTVKQERKPWGGRSRREVRYDILIDGEKVGQTQSYSDYVTPDGGRLRTKWARLHFSYFLEATIARLLGIDVKVCKDVFRSRSLPVSTKEMVRLVELAYELSTKEARP
jgi:hypothetical protein